MRKIFIILAMLVAVNSSAQWQPDVRLTNTPLSSYTNQNTTWCVASSGNIVHVVWTENCDWNYEIYYKRSTDAGVSWGADTRLTNSTSYSWYPSVAVTGSVVHVVWFDNRDGNGEIYYKRSTDAGVSWGADTRLTNNTSISEFPTVAVSGSAVHVVWHDYRNGNNGEIFYKRSLDAGISWGTDTPLTNETGYSDCPSVAVSGSVVHVVWHDNRDWKYEIYYKRSLDAGVSWGIDTRITNDTAFSGYPSVAVSDSIIHVVWYDIRDGNTEIYYKRSTNAGLTWGADIRLTNNTSVSVHPSVAVSDSVVHVVWRDQRDWDYEIYYKRSTDAGINWGADTRLTNSTDYSQYSSVAVSGSVVHVVWTDYRDGNEEIYYKRNPTGNLVGINNISTEIPSLYSLSQNYPNPFNPTTKIRFSVVNGFPIGAFGNDKVVLKVYDVMGRELQTLVNERLQPGTYEASFDGSALNSGVYFYKLITNGFTETKKMLLIK